MNQSFCLYRCSSVRHLPRGSSLCENSCSFYEVGNNLSFPSTKYCGGESPLERRKQNKTCGESSHSFYRDLLFTQARSLREVVKLRSVATLSSYEKSQKSITGMLLSRFDFKLNLTRLFSTFTYTFCGTTHHPRVARIICSTESSSLLSFLVSSFLHQLRFPGLPDGQNTPAKAAM